MLARGCLTARHRFRRLAPVTRRGAMGSGVAANGCLWSWHKGSTAQVSVRRRQGRVLPAVGGGCVRQPVVRPSDERVRSSPARCGRPAHRSRRVGHVRMPRPPGKATCLGGAAHPASVRDRPVRRLGGAGGAGHRDVGRSESGAASGIFKTSTHVGAAVAVAISAALIESAGHTSAVDCYALAYLTAAACAVLGRPGHFFDRHQRALRDARALDAGWSRGRLRSGGLRDHPLRLRI